MIDIIVNLFIGVIASVVSARYMSMFDILKGDKRIALDYVDYIKKALTGYILGVYGVLMTLTVVLGFILESSIEMYSINGIEFIVALVIYIIPFLLVIILLPLRLRQWEKQQYGEYYKKFRISHGQAVIAAIFNLINSMVIYGYSLGITIMHAYLTINNGNVSVYKDLNRSFVNITNGCRILVILIFIVNICVMIKCRNKANVYRISDNIKLHAYGENTYVINKNDRVIVSKENDLLIVDFMGKRLYFEHGKQG